MALAENVLSAITSSNSGVTQETGVILTAATSTIIDGNTVNLTYSGVSFDITVNYITESGGNYTGTVQHTFLDFYSANTLDFTGRTIWIDNTEITRTDRLIVSRGAQSGYILSAADSEGMVEWIPASGFGFSGGSGNCITDLYVTNVFGCSPIRVHDDVILSGTTAKKFGINKTPSYTFDMLSQDGASRVALFDSTNNQSLYMIGGSAGLYYMGVEGEDIGGITYGVVGKSATGISTYGVTGDSYVYSSALSNGLNVISASGTGTNDYIRFFAGSTAASTPDLHIQGSGTTRGYIGVGTSSPTEKLHVYGNTIISTGGTGSRLGINTTPTTTIHAIKNNSYLQFDESSAGPYLYVIGTSTQKPEIATGDGTVSIGMGVRGLTNTTNPQYGNKGDSYIYSEVDSNGLNIIQANGTGPNYIRFYANQDASNPSHIHIQGTGATQGYVGIGTESPSAKLHVYGNTVISSTGTNSRLGINTTSPQYVVDILGDKNRLMMVPYTDPTFDGARQMLFSGGTDTAPQYVLTDGVVDIAIGVRGTKTTSTSYMQGLGITGDTFIGSSAAANGLNICQFDTTPTNNNPHYIRFYAGQTAQSSNTADLHIQGSGATRGYVGIGTESPTQQLDVNDNARFRVIGASASAGALHYTADGTLTTNTSDERLKTNIQSLTNALDKVKNLRGVTYNWNETPNGDIRIGFIAQEVNEVVPELTFVNSNSPEKYMGVHYDNVTALLVEAIKELASGQTTSNATYLETQTIVAEDNNIELNFNGTHQSALDGGVIVKNGISDNEDVYFKINSNGDWTTNSNIIANGFVIPEYTPTSSSDLNGVIGNITRDDNYLYIKGTNGWRRTNLESF
jgi:hypothetical protein